jgi:hypothetical protein
VTASETYNTALEQHLRDTLGVRFAERPGTDPTKRPIREIVGVDPRLNPRWSTCPGRIGSPHRQLHLCAQAHLTCKPWGLKTSMSNRRLKCRVRRSWCTGDALIRNVRSPDRRTPRVVRTTYGDDRRTSILGPQALDEFSSSCGVHRHFGAPRPRATRKPRRISRGTTRGGYGIGWHAVAGSAELVRARA